MRCHAAAVQSRCDQRAVGSCILQLTQVSGIANATTRCDMCLRQLATQFAAGFQRRQASSGSNGRKIQKNKLLNSRFCNQQSQLCWGKILPERVAGHQVSGL